MREKISALFTSAFLICLLSACAAKRPALYYWGQYERLVHDMYLEPGKADTQTQIQTLSEDIQKAEARGQRVAPGVFAHLGMMYAVQGDASSAGNAFLEEKLRFPESAILIDGIMGRMLKAEGAHK